MSMLLQLSREFMRMACNQSMDCIMHTTLFWHIKRHVFTLNARFEALRTASTVTMKPDSDSVGNKYWVNKTLTRISLKPGNPPDDEIAKLPAGNLG